MPQYRRLYIPGGCYYFTVVTHERREILTSELGRRCFKSAWESVKRKRPFEVIAFCLLPDHLHCIWQLPDGDADYSRRWGGIKAAFSREYVKRGGEAGVLNESRFKKNESAVWQRRFWEHRVRDEDDLNRLIEYIHFNPVKHGWSIILKNGNGQHINGF